VNNWLFQANPEIYDIWTDYENRELIDGWTVHRYLGELSRGDRAAVCIAGPHDAGVYAVGIRR
jgi:hypothetical protein